MHVSYLKCVIARPGTIFGRSLYITYRCIKSELKMLTYTSMLFFFVHFCLGAAFIDQDLEQVLRDWDIVKGLPKP